MTEPVLDPQDQSVIDRAADTHAKARWCDFDFHFLALLHGEPGRMIDLVRLTEKQIQQSRELIARADALLARSGLLRP